jgi:hypothetical protein
MTIRRLHVSAIRNDSIRTLPTGGIAVDCVLCKVGVLEYRTPSGPVREYRTREALFARTALETLAGATLTYDHPVGKELTPDNYRSYVVGVVSEVRVDGDQVVGVVHIHDRAAIDSVMNGTLKDLSPGYFVALDPTPGVDPVHGAYDMRTTSVRYNHVSLLPPGQGRQGPGVCLRLDSAGEPAIGFPDMDPAEIEKLVKGMLPDLEALQQLVTENVKAQMPAIVQAAVAQAMAQSAQQAPAEGEPAVDGVEVPAEGEEPAEDDQPPPVEGVPPVEGEEVDPTLDAKAAIKPKEKPADPMAGAKPPADDKPEPEGKKPPFKKDSLDEPIEARADSRVIEIVRTVERVTGKSADLTLTPHALLLGAAQAVGLQIRVDASEDRLLGALESYRPSGWRPYTPAPADEAGERTADEWNKLVGPGRKGL